MQKPKLQFISFNILNIWNQICFFRTVFMQVHININFSSNIYIYIYIICFFVFLVNVSLLYCGIYITQYSAPF